MRDMAQLRLQDEVSRLEGSLFGTGGAQDPSIPACTGLTQTGATTGTLLPPYVIADAPTLCDHLTIVKQLAASSRFIIIIPTDGRSAVFLFAFYVLNSVKR